MTERVMTFILPDSISREECSGKNEESNINDGTYLLITLIILSKQSVMPGGYFTGYQSYQIVC